MRFEGLKLLVRFAIATAFILIGTQHALAHCDTMDGPVVKAARAALQTRNVNLVLIWIKNENESEVKQAFRQTLAVRKLNRDARELADKYFFETVVRIHRAGEGEPYTGLKPSGTPIEPAIALGDKALESGSADQLLKSFPESVHPEIRNRFAAVMARRKFNPNNVNDGRQYVAAYVSFLHLLEELHEKKSA